MGEHEYGSVSPSEDPKARRELERMLFPVRHSPRCREGCGHPENVHTFSTVTVADCANNCRTCRGQAE
jgi:hypothetical protein